MSRYKSNASIRLSKLTAVYNSVFLTPMVLLVLCVTCASSRAQQGSPVRLVQTIPLFNVKGRTDHMDVDVRGNRLFVAGLENGSLGVVDLKAGQWLRSIPGFRKPQGLAYVSSLNKLFVANGDDGMLRVFRGGALELLDSVKLDLGPNRVVYDPRSKLLYAWASSDPRWGGNIILVA